MVPEAALRLVLDRWLDGARWGRANVHIEQRGLVGTRLPSKLEATAAGLSVVGGPGGCPEVGSAFGLTGDTLRLEMGLISTPVEEVLIGR